MKHIVQVKVDHGVLGLRIPADLVSELQVRQGEFFVCTADRFGRLRYKKLKAELEYGHGIKGSKSG